MTNSSGAISAKRLRPIGPGGGRAALLASRLAPAALLLAAGWFGVQALRPLPAGVEPGLEPIPTLAERPTRAQRDHSQALAQLTGDNLFHPQRIPWAPEAIVSGEEAPTEGSTSADEPAITAGAPTEALGSNAEETGSAPRVGVDSIEIAALADVKPVIRRELDDLELRGIYGRDDAMIAMISRKSDKRRPAASMHAVGDSFDDGRWRVLAIDPVRDRVILRASDDVNVELLLYPTTESVASLPALDEGRGLVAQDALEGDVAASNETIDTIREELTEAGVEDAEVEELLELAERLESEPVEAEPTDDEEAPAEQGEESAPARGPEGLGAILRLMSRNPFDAEPTPPARQAPDAKTSTEEPEDGADDDS